MDVVVTADANIGVQGSEEVFREIDGLTFACATFVDEFASGTLAIKSHGGYAAAVGVTVGLESHHVWEIDLKVGSTESAWDCDTHHVRGQKHLPWYHCLTIRKHRIQRL